jgi:hypothetical protein
MVNIYNNSIKYLLDVSSRYLKLRGSNLPNFKLKIFPLLTLKYTEFSCTYGDMRTSWGVSPLLSTENNRYGILTALEELEI